MKVYLDDERPIPDEWVGVRWPEEAIRLLETGHVTHLSLDHDLGNDERGTGYDVILWIEEAVATRGFTPPGIVVHSANPSARIKMELAAIEDGDREVFLLALRNVAQAHGGMSTIAQKAHLKRESLYRMLSKNGNPELNSVFNVLHAVGLKLTVEPEGLKP